MLFLQGLALPSHLGSLWVRPHFCSLPDESANTEDDLSVDGLIYSSTWECASSWSLTTVGLALGAVFPWKLHKQKEAEAVVSPPSPATNERLWSFLTYWLTYPIYHLITWYGLAWLCFHLPILLDYIFTQCMSLELVNPAILMQITALPTSLSGSMLHPIRLDLVLQ